MNQRRLQSPTFVQRMRSAALAWLLLGLTGFAIAADEWKARYPQIVYAEVPNENASTTTAAAAPFVEYLSRKLGVKVVHRVATDFAAVIEGMRAGHIHIGNLGPSAYAKAVTTGVKIEPFLQDVGKDGSRGYHSVFYVKKDSPYKGIEDLKGKNLGLVDPNSTSGNNVPRYALNQMKIDPEKYFAKVVYTGSHENAVLALQQGTVDVAANWWNSDNESNLGRMVRNKMARAEDFRIIFKSDLIPSSPTAYLSDLPADMKAAIAQAFFDAPREAPEAFAKVSNTGAWGTVKHEAYVPVIELNRFVDNLRRQRQ
jgi:phosphonate transport system substrate-binding protein